MSERQSNHYRLTRISARTVEGVALGALFGVLLMIGGLYILPRGSITRIVYRTELRQAEAYGLAIEAFRQQNRRCPNFVTELLPPPGVAPGCDHVGVQLIFHITLESTMVWTLTSRTWHPQG